MSADSDDPGVEEAILCAPPGRVGDRAARWYAAGSDSDVPSAPPLVALRGAAAPGRGVALVNSMAE